MIGNEYPVYVIAEAGINHNGSLSTALKMIDSAKRAGVNCIKFQTHITEKEMIKSNIKPGNISKRSLWDIIKSCELTENEEEKIKKYCQKEKILFLSTPFSVEAVDRLEKLKIPAYKIGSGELTNFHLLHYVAQKNKPVILSTGMSTMNEIKQTVMLLKKFRVPLILMHTVSSYPADYSLMNLGVIEKLQRTFNLPIGISDHSLGIYVSLGAVAKGACVVEKHFTLNKKMPGPDQKISLEPKELAELVKGCKAVKLALGDIKKISIYEKPILKFARESVVSTTNIKKGNVFSEKNISTKRPSTGKIPAKDYFRILGKMAKRNIPNDKQLSWNDII